MFDTTSRKPRKVPSEFVTTALPTVMSQTAILNRSLCRCVISMNVNASYSQPSSISRSQAWLDCNVFVVLT
eukprot:6203444-Pleurochrysis_carterae.AAC.1